LDFERNVNEDVKNIVEEMLTLIQSKGEAESSLPSSTEPSYLLNDTDNRRVIEEVEEIVQDMLNLCVQINDDKSEN